MQTGCLWVILMLLGLGFFGTSTLVRTPSSEFEVTATHIVATNRAVETAIAATDQAIAASVRQTISAEINQTATMNAIASPTPPPTWTPMPTSP